MLFRLFVLAVLFQLGVSFSFACSCSDPDIRQRFRSSKAVFSGEVVSMTDLAEKDFVDSLFFWKAVFKVDKQWKGKKQKQIEALVAFDNPGWCGDLNVKVGDKFLIYAPAKDGRLLVYTDCGPNRNYKWTETLKEEKILDGFIFRIFARMYPFPKF